MSNKYILFFILSIISGAVTYIAIDNIFIALGVVAIYVVVSMLIFVPLLKKHEIKVKRFHECYHFVNNFIIALSITRFSSILLNPLWFLTSSSPALSSYFPFSVYRLFLQIISIWEEEGGDILQMSKYLITETRNNEEYISKADTMSRHKYVEISVLWAFCVVIVVVLRFALKDFYVYIKQQLIFMISVIGLMLFILVTIYLLIQKGTNLKIKGADINEKVA